MLVSREGDERGDMSKSVAAAELKDIEDRVHQVRLGLLGQSGRVVMASLC